VLKPTCGAVVEMNAGESLGLLAQTFGRHRGEERTAVLAETACSHDRDKPLELALDRCLGRANFPDS
jgi:hypothetical protein